MAPFFVSAADHLGAGGLCLLCQCDHVDSGGVCVCDWAGLFRAGDHLFGTERIGKDMNLNGVCNKFVPGPNLRAAGRNGGLR